MVWTLLGCAPAELFVPEPWSEPAIGDDTADSAAWTTTSPDGFGSCADVLSLDAIAGPNSAAVTRVGAAGSALDVTGWSDGPLALDPTAPALSPLADGIHFVARYDDAGALAWSVVLDGTSQEQIAGTDALPDGGSAIAGSADALATLNGVGGLGGAGESDVFVAAVGADGQVRWTRWFGSPGDDRAVGVAALPDGGIALAARVVGPAVVGAGEPAQTPVSPPTGAESVAVLARYAPDGALAWAVGIGGAEDTSPIAVDYDPVADEIVLLASVDGEGVTVFGAGTPAEELVDPGGADLALARFAPTGEFLRLARAGGGTVLPRSLAVAPDGTTAVGGLFGGDVVWSPGAPDEWRLDGPDGAFVARYAPDGALAWVATPATVDAVGVVGDEIVAVGRFSGELLLGGVGEAPTTRFVQPEGWGAAFVARYDAAGGLVCALSLAAVPTEVGSWLELSPPVGRGEGRVAIGGVATGSIAWGSAPVWDASWDGFVLTLELR